MRVQSHELSNSPELSGLLGRRSKVFWQNCEGMLFQELTPLQPRANARELAEDRRKPSRIIRILCPEFSSPHWFHATAGLTLTIEEIKVVPAIALRS